jgi:hypothetical protein
MAFGFISDFVLWRGVMTMHSANDQQAWPRNSIPLGIELRSERKLIGSTGCASINDATGIFGFVLHKSYWVTGLRRKPIIPFFASALDVFAYRIHACKVPSKVRRAVKQGMIVEGIAFL